MDSLREEVTRKLQTAVYRKIILNKPTPRQSSKTVGVAFLWFAMDEPQTCTRGGSTLNIPQASEILGKNARAFLMGISPTSVTKARQRLKAKLQ